MYEIYDSLDEFVTVTSDWDAAWELNRYYGGFIRDDKGNEWEYDMEPIDSPTPPGPA